MLPIVDTHQHLWDRDQFNLPWIDDVPPLQNDYRMSDYLEATRDLNVVKTVYMEVDVDPAQRPDEADFVIATSQADDNPMAGAVISGTPAAADFDPYIRRYADNKYIKGVRQVLHVPSTPQGTCLQEAYVAGVRLLGELGKSFDLCLRPAELNDATQLVTQCPDTLFILDHCGNADPYIVAGTTDHDPQNPFSYTRQQWLDSINTLAQQDNVICKISGIIARATSNWTPADLTPTINHCLDSFGPDRVVFGGDWPVCTLGATYAQWATALREIISPRSEADQRKLLHDNAVRLYSLD